MQNKSWKAYVALFAANLIYGINYPVAKDVMPEYIEPFGFIFLRVIISMSLFWILHQATVREKVKKSDVLRLVACGFFGVAANQLMFFKGLNWTTPVNASIIMTSNPVLVLAISAILLKESITTKKIIGIIVGMAGALLLITYGNVVDLGVDTFTGDLLVFLNAMAYGIYLVIVKPLMKRYHPLTVIKWVFTFGFVFVIPFGWQEFGSVSWSEMPAKIWMEAGFVVLCTTFLAYLLNVYALGQVNASVVSIFIYIQPVVAAILSILMFSESLTWIKIAAAVLVFYGVYLVSRPRSIRDNGEGKAQK